MFRVDLGNALRKSTICAGMGAARFRLLAISVIMACTSISAITAQDVPLAAAPISMTAASTLVDGTTSPEVTQSSIAQSIASAAAPLAPPIDVIIPVTDATTQVPQVSATDGPAPENTPVDPSIPGASPPAQPTAPVLAVDPPSPGHGIEAVALSQAPQTGPALPVDVPALDSIITAALAPMHAAAPAPLTGPSSAAALPPVSIPLLLLPPASAPAPLKPATMPPLAAIFAPFKAPALAPSMAPACIPAQAPRALPPSKPSPQTLEIILALNSFAHHSKHVCLFGVKPFCTGLF